MRPLVAVSCCLALLLLFEVSTEAGGVIYNFKRYTYKKKRDDKKYRNAKTVCEVKTECLRQHGVDQTACVRQCISKFCYNELYGNDSLEEGEIDVRLNSFKGCLAQEKRSSIYDESINNQPL
ncbi:uncharacterized protein LOC117325489 [Pecten maximus]|uniref:uncharacterized protein LOC117325489 n=1 Tax=Pecten maximus TaxID=6579 RepID=UPI0014586AC7|nr:uncharacterized protein LOC117325489 [Pecten maximus]XP_033737637.1 uncharacterized protein LOC117325489 [Pecten maximus]